MSYVHQAYPSWRYHATEPARVVNDEAEDKALGAGWYDSPAKAAKPEPKKEEPKKEVPAPAEHKKVK